MSHSKHQETDAGHKPDRSRIKDDTTVPQHSSSIRKPMRDLDKAVKPSEIEIDLRTDGIPQAAILSVKQHMSDVFAKI